jgi:hypothetical protein
MFAEISPVLQLIMENKSKIIELNLSSLKKEYLKFPWSATNGNLFELISFRE